jgi:hypothetical protein
MPNGTHQKYCSNSAYKKAWETGMDDFIEITVLKLRVSELEKENEKLREERDRFVKRIIDQQEENEKLEKALRGDK